MAKPKRPIRLPNLKSYQERVSSSPSVLLDLEFPSKRSQITMKLSFSLPRKSKSKSKSGITPTSDEKSLKKFVTEFDPSETLTDAKPNYVIPPIKDSRRNFHLTLQSASSLEFEAAGDGHISDKITFGLNLRQKVEGPVEPILPKSMRNDLKSLPDAPVLEDFESVPVEGFGAALLAGYGWKPGQGIGLKAKEDVQIVEYNKWTGNQGFGFHPDKARVKLKQSGELDKSRQVKGRQVSSEAPSIKGKIVEKTRQVEFKVLGINKIANVDKFTTVSKRSRETERKSITQVRAFKQKHRETASWLTTHIRVRIISKVLKDGRLYLKKAVVTNVVGPTTCDIIMDETQELVQRIHQELLETALPRRGGPVLVLSGRHKGIYGSLVGKDLDNETGVVCHAHSQDMLDVKLDQVAEYIGDPADIGY